MVKSVKNEIIDRQVLLGKKALSHSLKEYISHFHHERNHQELGNTIPFPSETVGLVSGKICKKERLGGLLKYYYRVPCKYSVLGGIQSHLEQLISARSDDIILLFNETAGVFL